MATTSPYLYPTAQGAHDLSSSYTIGDIPIQIAIAAVIVTAIAAGLFTTTIDLSSYTQLQINTQMEVLRGLGYDISYAVSTLTINF